MATTCEDALKTAREIEAVNSKNKKEHDDLVASYQRWQNAHSAWQSCYDNIASCNSDAQNKFNQLKDEIKPWNNCVAWNDACCRTHHDWCDADLGGNQEKWYHDGAYEGCSSGMGRGKCRRTDKGKMIDFREWYRQNYPEPTSDNGNKWLGTKGPDAYMPIDVADIECCQTFIASDIKAKSISFDNDDQICNVSNNKGPSSSPPPPSSSQSQGNVSNNKKIIIALIVLIVLCVCSICLSMIFGVGIFAINSG